MIDIKKADLQHGWSWVLGGLVTLKNDMSLWVSMGFVYMLIAIVLKLVPFIGLLLLVLISPMMLAGALQTAADQLSGAMTAPTRSGSGLSPQGITANLQRAAGRLFITFSDEEKLIPLMVISTLALGMVVAINILAVLLKIDGSALTAMAAGSVGPRVWVPALIGWFLVRFLQLGLIMTVLYSVPLILFRREMPLLSIEKSFTASKQNFIASGSTPASSPISSHTASTRENGCRCADASISCSTPCANDISCMAGCRGYCSPCRYSASRRSRVAMWCPTNASASSAPPAPMGSPEACADASPRRLSMMLT